MINDKGSAMNRSRGFTMLELMIVVTIIAILAALAIPAYGRYGYRARRPDGQELVLRLANAQERYYATNNKYGALSDIGFTVITSEKGYYNASMTVSALGGASSAAFTASAVPVAGGAQSKDACGTLSIDNAGVKLPALTDTTKNSNGSCW